MKIDPVDVKCCLCGQYTEPYVMFGEQGNYRYICKDHSDQEIHAEIFRPVIS